MVSFGNFTPAVWPFIANKSCVNFPVFKVGDDPQIWIRIAEQFLVHYDVPNHSKVSLVLDYIDKVVLEWMDVDSLFDAEWEEFASDLYYEFHQNKYGFNATLLQEHFQIYYNNLDKMEMDCDRSMLEEEEDSNSLEMEFRDEHKKEEEEDFSHAIEKIQFPVVSTVSSPNHLHLYAPKISCEPFPIPSFFSFTPPPQFTSLIQPSTATMRPKKFNEQNIESHIISHAHNLFDLIPDSRVFHTNTFIPVFSPHDPHHHNVLMKLPPPRPPSQPPDLPQVHEISLIPSPHWQVFCETLSLGILTSIALTPPPPQINPHSPPLKSQPQLYHSKRQLKLDFPLLRSKNFLQYLPSAELGFEWTHKILIALVHNGSNKTTCLLMRILCIMGSKLRISEAFGTYSTREAKTQNVEILRRRVKVMGISSQHTIPNHKAGKAVPSGALSGVYEATKLRTSVSDGKGVLKAVVSATKIIGGPVLIGMDLAEQASIHGFIVQQLDGAIQEWGWCKQKLGRNVILVVSWAVYKEGASVKFFPPHVFDSELEVSLLERNYGFPTVLALRHDGIEEMVARCLILLWLSLLVSVTNLRHPNSQVQNATVEVLKQIVPLHIAIDSSGSPNEMSVKKELSLGAEKHYEVKTQFLTNSQSKGVVWIMDLAGFKENKTPIKERVVSRPAHHGSIITSLTIPLDGQFSISCDWNFQIHIIEFAKKPIVEFISYIAFVGTPGCSQRFGMIKLGLHRAVEAMTEKSNWAEGKVSSLNGSKSSELSSVEDGGVVSKYERDVQFLLEGLSAMGKVTSVSPYCLLVAHASQQLEQASSTSPVLVLPDIATSFEVDIDACFTGGGAVLEKNRLLISILEDKDHLKRWVLSCPNSGVMSLQLRKEEGKVAV